MNFTQASNLYLDYVKVTKTQGTFKYEQSKVKVLLKLLGDIAVDVIDKFLVLEFVQFYMVLNENISNTTINKTVAVLNRVLKYIDVKPVEFKKLSETQKIIKIISDDTINLVFDYFKSKQLTNAQLRNYTMFKLLLDSGLRSNEIRHLKVNDIINFESGKGTIHVKKTKANRERYVFFREDTGVLLMKLIYNNDLKDYIFVNFDTKKPISTDSISSCCCKLKKELKLKEHIRPHRWRHTFATKYLKSGGNLKYLSQILGHSDLKITERYLHIDLDELHKNYFSL